MYSVTPHDHTSAACRGEKGFGAPAGQPRPRHSGRASEAAIPSSLGGPSPSRRTPSGRKPPARCTPGSPRPSSGRCGGCPTSCGWRQEGGAAGEQAGMMRGAGSRRRAPAAAARALTSRGEGSVGTGSGKRLRQRAHEYPKSQILILGAGEPSSKTFSSCSAIEQVAARDVCDQTREHARCGGSKDG